MCSIFVINDISTQIADETQVSLLLTEIGAAQDLFPNFYCVVSTLNSIFVTNVTKLSGRAVVWLSLPKPTFGAIMNLIYVKNAKWYIAIVNRA